MKRSTRKKRLRGTLALALALLTSACVWALVGTSTAAGDTPSLSPQVALDWNTLAVNAVRAATTTDGVPAGLPARPMYQGEGLLYLGYVQAAVYDAVTKIEHRYRPYGKVDAPAWNASPYSAVATAAYDTLTYFLGDPQGTLAAAYARTLTQLGDSGATRRGIAVGQAAASDIEALRIDDGRDAATKTYGTPGAVKAGAWQVVPPATYAQTPWLAFMKPLMLEKASQFRVPAPPALTSAEYARDFNETKAYGSLTSTVRTPQQTAIAYFWNANVINQQNQLYRDVATQHGFDLVDTVRLLAMGNMTAADASIACFDAKYDYLYWRPYTAIRNADLDGNAATAPDPTWTPLLATPNHPEYPSAHGCITGATTDVIAHVLGTNEIDVTYWGATNGGTALTTTQHFATVADIQKQVADARVWAGLHWRFSTTAGERIGNEVAHYVFEHYFQPVGSR
ncbi:MAG TPA: vanadium-dependent haloperoxidase [Gaiellaceae bacterium]|nr:vanadium-dependent haloperoxidase [Gaiellaceae bacterium]